MTTAKSKSGKKKSSRGPRVPAGKKLLQVPLDADIHKRFKIYSLMHDKTMIDLVTEFVRKLVDHEKT
jgi:hypothetical protein